jgi:hypothetical protein
MIARMLSRSYLVLLTALTSLISLARAQGTGSFTSPGPQGKPGDYTTSLTFQYGEQQIFTWTVDLPGVRLSLWQQGNASGIQYSGTEDIIDCECDRSFCARGLIDSISKIMLPKRVLSGVAFQPRI